jgi:hypothetical protein
MYTPVFQNDVYKSTSLLPFHFNFSFSNIFCTYILATVMVSV